MANVKANTMGAILVVCQSAAITKAGARPANRNAVAAPAICCIRTLSHHALGRGAVADLLAGARIPRRQDRDPGSVVEHCLTPVDAESPHQPAAQRYFGMSSQRAMNASTPLRIVPCQRNAKSRRRRSAWVV